MNYILKYGRNFMGISNHIDADCHKHWLLQMFLSSHNELNIKLNGQLVPSSAILVNMDTLHQFDTKGLLHFTLLADPTTELGRVMRALLANEPYYIFPNEMMTALQKAFQYTLEQNSHEAILSFAQSVICQFSNSEVKVFESVRPMLNFSHSSIQRLIRERG